MRLSYLLGVLVTLSSIQVLGIDKNVKLVVYVDRSGSMSKVSRQISRMTNILTDRLKQSCGRFNVAVSELEYQDTPNTGVSLLGTPKFLTEKDESAVEIISSRIRTGRDLDKCDQECITARSSVGFEETTYSSIANSMVAHQELIKGDEPVDLLAALIITNTIPIFETMSTGEALSSIHKTFPKTPFVATAISYNRWDKEYESCRADIPKGFGASDFSDFTKTGLTRFAEASGGLSLNVCREGRYRGELEQFIDRVIQQAGCYPMM